MKFLLRIVLLMIWGITFNQASAQNNKNNIYAFAVATSFNDSVVYISAINPLENASLDKKTKFLNDRLAYSNQFKYFLDKRYKADHTSAIFFSKKKESLEKQFVKLRRMYKNSKYVQLIEIPVTDFQFKSNIEFN